jgi:hypothetical protein
MIEITADMEAIIKQAILSFVATVNEDGTPNLSPKASLTVRNSVLYFADIASPRTIRNVTRNPAVEINVVDMFQRRGYRFTGRALVLSPGDEEYLMIADWVRATNGDEYPVDHVVKIDTTSITPLAVAGPCLRPAPSKSGRDQKHLLSKVCCETYRGIAAGPLQGGWPILRACADLSVHARILQPVGRVPQKMAGRPPAPPRGQKRGGGGETRFSPRIRVAPSRTPSHWIADVPREKQFLAPVECRICFRHCG